MRPAVLAMRLVTVLRGPHGPPAFVARLTRVACMAALPLLAACTDRPVTLPANGPAPAPPPRFSVMVLDEIWTGAVSTDWGTGGNWDTGLPPDSANGVDVPDDSLLASHTMPVLGADGQITDLRVGYASTLGLGGNTLSAWGNVDAVGVVLNGTLWMRGASALLGGAVDRLKVDGRVSLERPVVATRAYVAGAGSLSVQNNGLFVQVP